MHHVINSLPAVALRLLFVVVVVVATVEAAEPFSPFLHLRLALQSTQAPHAVFLRPPFFFAASALDRIIEAVNTRRRKKAVIFMKTKSIVSAISEVDGVM